MKRIALTTILLGALGMVIPAPQARAQAGVPMSVGTFYDELSPYGEWVDCTYGDCWVPRGVGAGWQPYTNGEWIYTRYGWTWVSSDPWGADPYHYGTWAFVDRYGWVWVPGTVWAPAWVTWSYSDSYVGWAPMPPTVVFGSAGYSGRPVVENEARYVFVPTNRFVGTNVMSVRVEPRQNAEILRQAKSVTRFGVSGGIVTNVALPMATVQRATGGRIETREISIAKTTPRTLSSGGLGRGGHVALVAPAGEMKAARASRQVAAPHAAAPGPQHEQQPKVQPQHTKPQKVEQKQAKVQPQVQQQPQAQPQSRPQPQQQPKVQPQHAKPRQEEKKKENVQPHVQPQHEQPPNQQQPKVQPPQGREKAIPAGEGSEGRDPR
jgi:hypothetical protein